MTNKMKQLVLLGGLGCVLILIAGYFLLLSPKKGDIKDVQAQTASVEANNATLQQQITQLTQQQQGLLGKQVELSQVAQRIPSDEQLPALIRALSGAADDTGIDVTAITPGQQVVSAVAAPVATAAATAAPSASSSASPAAGATTTTTAAHAATASVASYTTDPINLSVQGSYSQMVMFLDKLESMQRLWVVKGITVAPAQQSKTGAAAVYAPNGQAVQGDALTATITGEVYQTSADTTTIDLPALQGASGTSTAPTTTSN